jgi:hypothetical protein
LRKDPAIGVVDSARLLEIDAVPNAQSTVSWIAIGADGFAMFISLLPVLRRDIATRARLDAGIDRTMVRL